MCSCVAKSASKTRPTPIALRRSDVTYTGVLKVFCKAKDMLIKQRTNQSCNKYWCLATKFPENSKTWQKYFQHSFVIKDIASNFFAISSITEQIFLNFSTVDQKLFNVLLNTSNEEFQTSASLSKNYYSFFNITRNFDGLKATFSYLKNGPFQQI